MKKDSPAKPATERDPNARKMVTVNRRARHEYEILETVDAGLVLVGTEVKSLRAGKTNIQDAFCRIENGEAWIYNMHVNPYELGNRSNVEPLRKRKLLLHSWQIEELRAKTQQKGLTLVPLNLYFQRGFAKMEIGLGRGKKLYDKRESITEKDQQREAQRQVFGRGRDSD
jgi:SsrA-binding protein